jgi:Sec-independent protein translocase protein TatA
MDIAVILVVVLILVLLWRGPKTLPKLGEALGRGVREARREVAKADEPESPSDPVTPIDAKRP